MSDSPGLVDSIWLVNSLINLPDGQVNVFREFKLLKNFEINLLIKTFLGLVEMIFGLVNVSFSLPEWQAVKMTFFAPCQHKCIFVYPQVANSCIILSCIFNFFLLVLKDSGSKIK